MSLFVCGRAVERAKQAIADSRKGSASANPSRVRKQAATFAAGRGEADGEAFGVNMVVNPAMLAMVRWMRGGEPPACSIALGDGK